MSGETYKGFRIFNLEFQAMQLGQSNVVMYDSLSSGGEGEEGGGSGSTSINYETAGKIINTSTNAVYWTCDDAGLRSHLLEYLQPMTDQSLNGVGWELDDATYSRLRSIVTTSDPSAQSMFATFINNNSDIYDSISNQTGDKTIKLVPTSNVRVMCFRHTYTGYKAMIGLSLYAMDGDNYVTTFQYNANYGKAIEPGFRSSNIVNYIIYNTEHNSGTFDGAIGGLFIAMIPPANPSEEQDDWKLEYSIQDANFYSPTMTKVQPFMYTKHYPYTSSNSNFSGASWLKSSTAANCARYNAGKNAGVPVGTNMKLSLLLDIKGNIGLSYKYTASTYTQSLTPLVIMGPLYKKKLFANDTLCTSKLGVIKSGFREMTSNDWGYALNAAWVGSYNGSYLNYFYGSGNSGWDYLSSFSADGSSFNNYSVFTAYPAVDSSVHLNYRNAKAGYTTSGLIDEEVIRWNAPDGLVRGQTYNNGEWAYLGTDYTLYAQNGTTSESYLYPSIKWDAQYNGTKTFA